MVVRLAVGGLLDAEQLLEAAVHVLGVRSAHTEMNGGRTPGGLLAGWSVADGAGVVCWFPAGLRACALGSC